MPNYKSLYYKTYNAITDAEKLITKAAILLKSTQQECEEVVLNSDDIAITLMQKSDIDFD